MRFPKVLAVIVFTSMLLFALSFASGMAMPATDPPRPSSSQAEAVAVAVEEQEAAEPGQGLGDVLGMQPIMRDAKGGLTGDPANWYATRDFTVTGNTCLEPGSRLHLDGHRLTIYGDLTISGTMILEKGSIIVSGSLIIEDGLLVMKNTADYVQVGKSFIANGRAPIAEDQVGTDILTAGKIKVAGDFLQIFNGTILGDNPKTYSSTGTHITEFTGTNKLIQFQSPEGSSIRNPVFASGMTFTADNRTIKVFLTYVDADGNVKVKSVDYISFGGTHLSISKALAADYTIKVPYLYYSGLQGGWKLTVLNGSLIVPPGATQAFTGNVLADKIFVAGTMNLATAGKTIASTEQLSVSGTLNQTAGTITTKLFETDTLEATGVSGAAITVNKHTSGAAGETSFTAPVVNINGSLGGRKLTVNGSLAIPSGDILTPEGGAVDVTGNITVDGSLAMNNAADAVHAGGDFLARSGNASYTQGALSVGGKFRQFSAANGGADGSFTAGPGFTVRLLASQSAWGAVFDTPESSWFTNLMIAAHPAAAMASNSVLSIRGSLSADIALPAPVPLTLSGSLGGHKISTQGDVIVPAGQALDVGAGRLDVAGDMTVNGLLQMDAPADTVVVGGVFKACGGSADGLLTNGYLALEGGFVQQGDPASFKASGSHKTLLCGSGARSVTFANGESAFANLYILNPDIEQAVADGYPCTGARVMTGTKLSGITVDGSSLLLNPGFDADTLAYEAVVHSGVASVTVAPQLALGNQTAAVSVGGVAKPGGVVSVPAASHATADITVLSAAGQPYAGAGAPFAKTYTLTLQPENTELSSPGYAYAADTSFKPATLAYAVTVPVKDGSFTFSPVTANPNASFKFVCGGVQSAGPSFTRTIALNESVKVDVFVTAYTNAKVTDPEPPQTYSFTFRRQTLLDGIGLSCAEGVNEAFAYGTAAYTVDVHASVWSVIVSPDKGDGCSTLAINGAAANAIDLRPAVGCSSTATMVLTDSTGTYSATYTLTVHRAPLLSDITVSSTTGTDTANSAIKPVFLSGTNQYIAYVPVNCDTVTVSGVKAPDCTGLTVNGQSDSFSPVIAAGGWQDVVLVASAGDAAEQKAAYTVKVGKPLLIGIVPSSGRLNAPFDPNNAVMTSIMLPYTASMVTLTPMGNDGGKGLVMLAYYEGGVRKTGTAPNKFTLTQGQTRNIVVRAAFGGVSRDYAVRIYREKSDNAYLKSIGASAGWLTPAFNAAVTSYSLMLPETISTVTLKPVRADAYSKFSISGLKYNTNKTVRLNLNGSYAAKIVVTALRGNTKTYLVTVRRKAMLAGFSAAPVYAGYPSLSPGGTNRLTFNYSLNMPAKVKIEVKKGSRWYSVLYRTETSAGAKAFAWDGRVNGAILAAGTYSVRITPYWAGRAGTRRTLTIKILSKPAVYINSVSPPAYTPDGSNRLTASFQWTRLSDVKAEVVDSAGVVVKLIYSAVNQAPATRTAQWDGINTSGELVASGTYRIKVTCGGAAPVYKVFTVVR